MSRKITVSFVSKKILAASIPSATQLSSCTALNEAAVKQNSMGHVTVVILLLSLP